MIDTLTMQSAHEGPGSHIVFHCIVFQSRHTKTPSNLENDTFVIGKTMRRIMSPNHADDIAEMFYLIKFFHHRLDCLIRVSCCIL